jgi:hypothetical protein
LRRDEGEGGGWSIGVLQSVLDMMPRDGFEVRGDAAVLPGCAGRRGDRGGEVGELEVDSRRGDWSLKLRRQTGASESALIWG